MRMNKTMATEDSSKNILKPEGEEGFTLIEIILTLSLLLGLTIISANMIKNSIDMRAEISNQVNVNHRLSMVMELLTQDLRHAFLVSRKRKEGFNPLRRTKTAFFLKPSSSSELSFTTLNHSTRTKDSSESDQAFVIYQLETDEETGRTNLYRGESTILPENFDEVKANVLVANDIKVFSIKPWDGVEFSSNRWNSDSSSQRDLLPKMVEIYIEAWDLPVTADVSSEVNLDQLTTVAETILNLPLSASMDTEKTPVSSFQWKNL